MTTKHSSGASKMNYYRGSLSQFNIWHDAAKISENIPAEGKIGNVKGVPAPTHQRTTAYSDAVLHPTNNDDYVWVFLKYPDDAFSALSLEQIKSLGWFPGPE